MAPLPLDTIEASIWLNSVNNLLYSEGQAQPVSFADGSLVFDYTTGCSPLYSAQLLLDRTIQRYDQPQPLR